MLTELGVMNFAMISLLWTIPLKGISMWLSAKRDNKIWFVFFLIVHTFGIIEIVYLLMYGIKELNLKSKTSKPKSKSKSRKKK